MACAAVRAQVMNITLSLNNQAIEPARRSASGDNRPGVFRYLIAPCKRYRQPASLGPCKPVSEGSRSARNIPWRPKSASQRCVAGYSCSGRANKRRPAPPPPNKQAVQKKDSGGEIGEVRAGPKGCLNASPKPNDFPVRLRRYGDGLVPIHGLQSWQKSLPHTTFEAVHSYDRRKVACNHHI